jgi:hypothetical protein
VLDSDNFLTPSGIPSPAKPSSPIRKESKKIRERVLAAFHHWHRKEAYSKSQAQLNLCETMIAKEHNIVAVLSTMV